MKKNINICAGIVLYNPVIEKLKRNITAIADQVEEIVLVDNGSKNIEEIEQSLDYGLSGIKLQIIKNKKNLGIGKALNQILDFAERQGFEWFLTLDQDSVCKSGLVDRYLSFINKTSKIKIGQITCNIIDEKLGVIEQEQYYDKEYVRVDTCITSGCINNVNAIKKVGRFNERFFIDGVDIEISLRLRKHGFSIIKINYDGLDHSLGDGQKVRFIGKEITLTHHAPWRSYYMRRNFIYIARKHYSKRKKIMLIVRQIAISIGTVLLEDHKIDRIKYCTRGIIDGFRME